MNNLLAAYDADSDDESPRRRSSDASKLAQSSQSSQETGRRRRTSDAFDSDGSSGSPANFAEPPPPKRVSEREHTDSPAAFRTPQASMPHTSSQLSLVSYSGDGDDDDMDTSEKPSAPASELYEPAPPIRQSEDAESDEEQQLIDLAIQEGNAAMSRLNEEFSPAGSDTPGRDRVDSPATGASDSEAKETPIEEEEIRIPPAPDCEVDPAVLRQFEVAFQQKAKGIDMNTVIQGNQQYNNPMSYDTFIERFEIDEKGTNFAKNIFNPHVFPENCFYDKIWEEQKRLTEGQGHPKKKN